MSEPLGWPGDMHEATRRLTVAPSALVSELAAEMAARMASPDGGPLEDDAPDLVALARLRFHGIDRDGLDTVPAPVELVAGLMPRHGIALLSGSFATGKSLLALDWSGCIAHSIPSWRGRQVLVHGPVLYAAMEGFTGVPNRVRAWEQQSQVRADNIIWLRDPIDLRKPLDAQLLAAYAVDIGAVLLVLDSARATGAGAEDTKDMGAYVAGLETLRRDTGAAVIVLHNAGWDSKRERGSTLLPDACDATLLMEGPPDGVRSLRHRKYRDGVMLEQPLMFTFRAVDGTDSGVLVPVAHDQQTLRDRVLSEVHAAPGQGTKPIADTVGAHRSVVSTILSGLRDEGLVINTGTTQRPSWEPTSMEPLI